MIQHANDGLDQVRVDSRDLQLSASGYLKATISEGSQKILRAISTLPICRQIHWVP